MNYENTPSVSGELRDAWQRLLVLDGLVETMKRIPDIGLNAPVMKVVRKMEKALRGVLDNEL